MSEMDRGPVLSKAVLDRFLETGEPSSIMTLAESTGVSDTTIRRYVAMNFGLLDSCDCTKIPTPVHGKDGTFLRNRFTTGWSPSKERLRELFLSFRLLAKLK